MQNHAPCLLLLFEKEKKNLCANCLTLKEPPRVGCLPWIFNYIFIGNFLTEGTLYSQTFDTSDYISHQVPIKVKLQAANESHSNNCLIVWRTEL